MTIIKQYNPATATWVPIAQGTRGPQGPPGLSNGLYINVIECGAKGDGATDDTAAINVAFAAAAATGGIIHFPAGKVYMTTGGHVHTLANTTDSNPIMIEAYGASIKLMSGSGQTVVAVHRDNMNALLPAPYVKGGTWIDASGGTGNTCFKFRDIGPRMEDVTVRGFAGGKAIFLQNWKGWTEQSRIVNCGASGCRHAIYFSDGADSGGPSGTTSFARTQVHNMVLSNGEAGYGLIRTTGNTYHSSFVGLWGNLSNIAAHVIQDDSVSGSFNGSRVHFLGFEGAASGSCIYYRPTGVWPLATNIPDIYGWDHIGPEMTLTNLSDPGGNMFSSFTGKVRAAGYTEALGTEWGIGLPGNKSIVSGRHPSGPNPGGTRVTWAELTTTDELVIGSTNAGRAPVSTMLGRMAPVKICAPTQPLGFFDAAPVLRQTGVTARAALEALGLGATLIAEGGASYTENPPTIRAPGTIWFMPSLRHQAIWTGTTWEAMSPTDPTLNACCVVGNFDLLVDAAAWSGTGAITNSGVGVGLTTTLTALTQGTDANGRKYFAHDGAAGDITLSSNALYNIGSADSFTLFIVKSQAAYTVSTAIFTNRASVTPASSVGWGLFTGPTTDGVHAARFADGVAQTGLSTLATPTNQIKLFLVQRNVALDQLNVQIGTDAAITATDTTTSTMTNANVPRIGRLAAGGVARTAMNHYVSAFRKRALSATEITTLQTWAAARFI